MSIAKKYDIPEDKIKAMVRDGIIPAGAIKLEAIISTYQTYKIKLPKSEAVKVTSDEFNVSVQYVYQIINKLL